MFSDKKTKQNSDDNNNNNNISIKLILFNNVIVC